MVKKTTRRWLHLLSAVCVVLALSFAPVNSGVAQNEGGEGAADGNFADIDPEVRSLEVKVNRLKDEIFRSKTRLLLLQEVILNGPIAGARVQIVHHNDLGGWFKLDSVVYYLDGSRIFRKVDMDGDLDSLKTITLYDGVMTPGTHLVSVMMTYRGDSGMFNYVEGLQVQLKSSHTFEVQEGMRTRVDVYGYDKGGWLADLKDRPGVYAKTTSTRLTEEDMISIGAQDGEDPEE